MAGPAHRADGSASGRGPEPFDPAAGGRLERLVFAHRRAIVLGATVVTVALGAVGAARHEVNADFARMLPTGHPFVRSYLENAGALRALGNSLHVVVESTTGSVYSAEYLEALRRITDELFLLPGVDRAWVKSLWMPAVRWTEVTEEGFRGGPVMPDGYDGTPAALLALRRNVALAGIQGHLVASDERSSVVFVPLLDRDPATGAGIDYRAFSARLEAIREAHEGAGGGPVRVRIVGFAKRVGELLDGIAAVAAWFLLAAAISAGALLLFTRCLRSTLLVVGCSVVALVWQVGLVSALGLPLDPFSVLVPFLVFALGVSHGVQRMNGVLQDVGRGAGKEVAARRTFRRLLAAGLTALLTDAVGFATLLLVAVPAIRQMAVTATIGVGVLLFTDLVLLPVLLSHAGVSPAAAARSLRGEAAGARAPAAWRLLERLTERRYAAAVLAVAAAATAGGLVVAGRLAIGDLDRGAPELRPGSRYNLDDAYLAEHYDLSSDRFAVIVRTAPDGCAAYRTLVEADRLGWELRQLPGVRTTTSLADAVREITAGSFEGNPKWRTLSRDQAVLNQAAQQAVTRNPELFDVDCAVMPVVAHLSDHRAETLDRVVGAAEAFARSHSGSERAFLLAAGSAGFEAATNLVVRDAMGAMTACVFAAVVLLCRLALRSWRAVVVTVVPLAVTSVLCEALMVRLGIGVKVATLPVIALGVGIPDYALYLVTLQLAHLRAGLPLREAWGRTLRFTGRAVALVGVTLAAGVVTWAWSPLRLQADMGLLLTFMFLGNMVAALVLVPALSRFLLPRAEGGA